MKQVLAVAFWALAFLGAVAVLGGAVVGCVAVSILFSPWWLFAAVPVGSVLAALAIGVANAVLEHSMDWASR